MIRELKTLLAVVQAGTFAGAAQRIGLSQAGVSAQLKRLEEALGVTLFERQGRASLLTAQGRQVLGQAQELLTLYEKLGQTTGDVSMQRVTIGAIASMQRLTLPDALARFHRDYPTCTTRVLPGVSMALLDQVDAGELDMAVIIRPPFALQSDLRWHTLACEPFRLLVSTETPAGDDWRAILQRYPFVRYDRASFGGRQVERFLRAHHCRVQDVCEVDELDTIVALVAKRVGVALVPESSAWPGWPEGVRAVALGEHGFHRDIGLVHRGEHALSEPARALADQLINAAPDARA